MDPMENSKDYHLIWTNLLNPGMKDENDEVSVYGTKENMFAIIYSEQSKKVTIETLIKDIQTYDLSRRAASRIPVD